MASISKIDEYRDQVAKRVQEEEEKYPTPPKGDGGGDEPPLDFVRKCYHSNEVGDSMLYNYFCRDKFAYNVTSGRWMHYIGPHWDIDRDGRALAAIEKTVVKQYLRLIAEVDTQIAEAEDNALVKNLRKKKGAILKRLDRLRSHAGRKNTLACAASNDDPLVVKELDFDKDPWLLACQNGVVDLRTGVFREGRPEDYIMKCAPVVWKGLDEPCPEFEAFLDEILDGNKEVIEFLNRLLGYTITGANIERIFTFLYGEHGQNGKGTLMEVLYSILGSLAGPIQAEMLMSQRGARNSAAPSPDIMDLKGRRLAWASEPEEGNRFAVGKIKLLTGGDPLVGRNPNDKDQTIFLPTHTLFLLSNNKPHAPAHDSAFWARLFIIEFPFTFVKNRPPKKDWERVATPGLAEKLLAESSGILARLVRGCLEYQNKGLAPPESVIKASVEYQRYEDTLEDFLEERCVVGPDHDELFSRIYSVYKGWWEEVASSRPMTKKKFGDLLSMKFEKKKTSGNIKYFGLKISFEKDAS